MAANPLVINAAELLRRAGTERTVELSVTDEELGIADDRLQSDRPIRLDLRLEALNDGALVHGTVAADWHGVCRRCLTDLTGTAVAVVDERYQLRVTDPDAFPITDNQIDLRDAAGQLVLLELPDSPLCRPDCAGLCPSCGVDRNITRCACEAPDEASVWTVLDRLRDDHD
jgi:uncharacterized protein